MPRLRKELNQEIHSGRDPIEWFFLDTLYTQINSRYFRSAWHRQDHISQRGSRRVQGETINQQTYQVGPQSHIYQCHDSQKPKDIFTKILAEFSQSYKSSQAMYLLNDFFSKGFSAFDRNIEILCPKILVIDEIDYLFTKDQQIIYSILEWTQTKNSRLILIAISNTMDFVETLSGKVRSRMGNRMLAFKQYTSQQIQTILRERIADKIEIFDTQSVQFICKKIVRCSSDIRKCLNVLKKSIQAFIGKSLKDKVQGKVPLDILTKVYDQTFTTSFSIFKKNFPRFHITYKVILFILAKYFRYQNVGITLTQLQKRYNSYMKCKGNNIRGVLVDMRDCGYLDIKFQVTRTDKRINRNIQIYRQYEEQHITLLISVDDIFYAASQDQNNIFILED